MTTGVLTAGLFCGLLAMGPLAGTATAGATDPVLALGRFVASPAGPAALVDVTGAFGFDDALQVPYPLNVVVYQGTTFVRLPIGGTPRTGDFAGLADGLSTTEIGALESSGSTTVEAEILILQPHRVQASLPPVFTEGLIRVVVYVELPGEGSFVSNTLVTPLVGIAGGGS